MRNIFDHQFLAKFNVLNPIALFIMHLHLLLQEQLNLILGDQVYILVYSNLYWEIKSELLFTHESRPV